MKNDPALTRLTEDNVRTAISMWHQDFALKYDHRIYGVTPEKVDIVLKNLTRDQLFDIIKALENV